MINLCYFGLSYPLSPPILDLVDAKSIRLEFDKHVRLTLLDSEKIPNSCDFKLGCLLGPYTLDLADTLGVANMPDPHKIY